MEMLLRYIVSRWKIPIANIERFTKRTPSGDVSCILVYGNNGAPLYEIAFTRDGVEVTNCTQNFYTLPKDGRYALFALAEKVCYTLNPLSNGFNQIRPK